MNDKRKAPIKVNLQEGKRYSFCTCGLSKNIPYCDNAHRAHNEKEGTDYKSIKIFPQADAEVMIFSATWKR